MKPPPAAGAVALSLVLCAAAAGPVAAAPGPQAGTAELARWADDVEILRTRAGAPLLRLSARRSLTDVHGRTELSEVRLQLYGSDGSETLVEAPRARSMPEGAPGEDNGGAQAGVPAPQAAAEGSIGSWLLEDGVTIRAANGLIATMLTLAILEPSGLAQTRDTVRFVRGPLSGEADGMVYRMGEKRLTFASRIRATMSMTGMGRVRLEAASGSCDLAGEIFEATGYKALTDRGETLSGAVLKARFDAGRGSISRLDGEGGFTLETSHAIPSRSDESPLARLLALEGRRDLSGEHLAVTFAADGAPATMEVTGQAIVKAAREGALNLPSSLAARTLQFDLQNGGISRVRAEGGVDLRGAPPAAGEPGFHLNSDHLEASMDPDHGSLLKVEGAGEIRLTDRGLESEGTRTTLDPNVDIVTLTGESDRPATATWLGRKIEAHQRIEVDRRRRTLSAVGGVRASYRPEGGGTSQAASTSGVPFFDSGSTIYVMAGRLTLAEQGSVAQYRDHVRLWQGENRLEAAEVDVQEKEGRLDARGEVTSAFRPGRAEGATVAPPAPDEVITVAAESMRFSREAHQVVYAGSVVVTRGTTRISSQELRVNLSADGSRADSLEANGGVTLRDPGRIGQGDRLSLDLRSDTIVLSGTAREAVVQDEAGQQVVRGRTLTLERTGDRILVESERAGRSWITLKPRQKGAPGVGSKPHD